MVITIGKPCAISEKGSRQNNEDYIHPAPETVFDDQKLFLVCDGVGGAEKGEIASSLACELFETYFNTFLEGNPTPAFINKTIHYTEAHFDEYVSSHPDSKGMATTLTMVYFGDEGVTLAHIGDSRIYHIRNGKILFRTEDHSLVNTFVKLGQITPEEAEKHPQKNVITRALQSTENSTEADVVLIKDVLPGDYFFMCTDGVLENVTEKALCNIFGSTTYSENVKDRLMELCNEKTRDNYSFYIIPVQNVMDSIGFRQNLLSFFYSFV